MSTPPFLELPASARARTLVTSRGPLAVHIAAPNGPPGGTVVLVPGFTGSKEDFLPLLEPLVDAGFLVVALDLRGQHESPPAPDGGYALEALGADLLAAIDALDGTGGKAVHLVGHSFGGIVAREAVLFDPGAAAVRSLTLLCCGPGPVTTVTEADRLRLLLQVVDQWDLEQIWQAMKALEEAAGQAVTLPADIAEFLHRRFVSNDRAGIAALARHLLDTPDRTEALAVRIATTGLPVLVACGVDDDVWSPQEQRATAERLGAPFVALDDAGHSPAVEQPLALTRVLTDFWATVPHQPAQPAARPSQD